MFVSEWATVDGMPVDQHPGTGDGGNQRTPVAGNSGGCLFVPSCSCCTRSTFDVSVPAVPAPTTPASDVPAPAVPASAVVMPARAQSLLIVTCPL